MARVFHLTLGSIEKFAVADDYEDMYQKRAEVDPAFAYTPVEIKEMQIPGYEIEAYEIKEEKKVSKSRVKKS
ncbi:MULTISPECIES: hypothetical protein [Bacillus cereus group]|uniref:Uncharacterized protein n=1 Tax=Bacillus thuringiensis subsp. medellin TaxID=79672 RepID=A0A9X6N235_BACTV|nr:hypothetical protein [Bacillus thuringiensis]MCQ6307067.1 hypothetical protein [Bacillus cereus]OUB91682.1 hypothetical protein BK784_23990 [Bacillus thuringiensis serovar medellin]OUB91697.1 hypothetical protein BK784_23955 [Bacillus thuringiensis serovar medellin]OUB93221.1 hypothetical protein BK784_22460 [Bacillus thuringiensis serovar medellin]